MSPHSEAQAKNSTTKNGSAETAEQQVRQIWRKADAVCFDVDSTVCQDEAIDELAKYLGVGEEIAEATRQAMNGGMRFRDALSMRLDIMRPSQEMMHKYVTSCKPKLTPGIKELVSSLHSRKVDVYLVSGGFRFLISPVADLLGINHDRIYANKLFFDENGKYAGFDLNEPTSDSGTKEVGKPAVIALLRKARGYKHIVMIGDGATDLEACPPADAFIGFGGNQIRESVKNGAGWFVTDFEVLRRALE